MARFISTQEIAAHLRLGDIASDDVLYLYADAACDYVRAVTRRELPDTNGDVPPAAKAAALLLLADMYENREAQTAERLSENKTVERLLWPLRVF